MRRPRCTGHNNNFKEEYSLTLCCFVKERKKERIPRQVDVALLYKLYDPGVRSMGALALGKHYHPLHILENKLLGTRIVYQYTTRIRYGNFKISLPVDLGVGGLGSSTT